jgi:hypothetical protein
MFSGTTDDAYDVYCYKLERAEKTARRIESEKIEAMKEKDKEIKRLKLKVNNLIAQINSLERKALTDDEIFDALCEKGMLGSQGQYPDPQFLDIARVIEQRHGIKT